FVPVWLFNVHLRRRVAKAFLLGQRPRPEPQSFAIQLEKKAPVALTTRKGLRRKGAQADTPPDPSGGVAIGSRERGRSTYLQVPGGARAFPALLQFILDALALGEAGEPRTFLRRDVDEHVL